MTANVPDQQDPLYLIKSGCVCEYHLQNLAILNAPEGEFIETSYSARWVQPGLKVQRGRGPALRLRVVLNETRVHISVETGFDVSPAPRPDRPQLWWTSPEV